MEKAMERLTALVRPRTAPLGVRLIRGDEEPPKEAMRPKRLGVRISLCQWTTLARTSQRPVAVLAEDVNCSPCLAALGLKQLNAHEDLAEYFMDMGYFSDPDAALKVVRDLAPIPYGTLNGLLMFPLDQSPGLEPDLVWIYGTPAQVSRLAAGWLCARGELVRSATTGFGISCLAMMKPLFTGKPVIVVPGRGERILAGTEEDEVAFCAPASELEAIIDGLEKTHQAGSRYPIQRYVVYEPRVLKAMEKLEAKLGAASS